MSQGSSTASLRVRTITFWTSTLLVAFENAAGAMWVVLPLIPLLNHLSAASVFHEYLRLMLTHLGYPPYFKYILGPWQLACAAVLISPSLPRAKEWAYIGGFFNYSSAIVSHLFAGDGLDFGAAVFAVLTIVSWALRPPDRRLESSASIGETTGRSWATSVAILCFLLLMSLFWLPKLPKP